jgi:hypothetical protein
MKCTSLKNFVVLGFLCFILISAKVISSSVPPEGHTGEFSGITCRACHDSHPLNNPGGNVSISGLPSVYTAGTTYTFSVTIRHANPDRTKWGFSIKANNSLSATAGTFSTTNGNVIVNGAELSHQNAVATAATNSFTYSNLRWTAPATPVAADQSITFFIAGNAANSDFSPSGDFIYTAQQPVSLQTTSVTDLINGIESWNVQAVSGRVLLRIRFETPTVLAAALYTSGGKLLSKLPAQKYLSGNQQIEMNNSTYQPGVYILILQSGSSKTARKFVIE